MGLPHGVWLMKWCSSPGASEEGLRVTNSSAIVGRASGAGNTLLCVRSLYYIILMAELTWGNWSTSLCQGLACQEGTVFLGGVSASLDPFWPGWIFVASRQSMTFLRCSCC